MPTRKSSTGDTLQDIHFPYCGIDVSGPFMRQPVRQTTLDQKYSRTTPHAINVRAYDSHDNRLRGGSRSGLGRYIDEIVSAGGFIQGLGSIVAVGIPATGGNVQSSSSARVVTLVAVSNGNVKVANPGDTSWTTPTNGLACLNASGIVFSAANASKLYFADGVHYVLYNPATNSVLPWTATAGSLPVDSLGNKPRLIETWRGRTVVSGLINDPQNWFMSAVDAPTDFDYGPLSTTPTQAVAGNNSTLGLVGDVVTSLVPFSDDVLVFGGDHTLWQMLGDPMDGGRLNRISDIIGMAWGRAWCKDPYGNIFFFSNQCGVYVFTPSGANNSSGGVNLQRISQPIDNLLRSVNTGSNTISMAWDDRWQGFHVFVTKTSGAFRAVHVFYESRSGAWFTDVFTNKNHNPLCCANFDGNTSRDRVVAIGSWDGYVRFLNPEATDDDGTAITSSVMIGPFLTKDQDEVMLKAMNGMLGETSGDVNYEVFIGTTAEKALGNGSIAHGTWGKGRNLNNLVRGSGHAVYIKLTSTVPWALEQIVLVLQTSLGKTRRRGA